MLFGNHVSLTMCGLCTLLAHVHIDNGVCQGFDLHVLNSFSRQEANWPTSRNNLSTRTTRHLGKEVEPRKRATLPGTKRDKTTIAHFAP